MCSPLLRVAGARRLFLSLAALLLAARAAASDLPNGAEPSADSALRSIEVRLSAGLFEQLFERPIDLAVPVNDVILETRVIGQARVQGEPQVTLVDDSERAVLTVVLSGTIRSHTIGQRGPVRIFGGSQTEFVARKRIVFDPRHGFVGEPTQLDLQTKVFTQRIEARRRGPVGRAIERIAWSRIEASRSEVNAIVRQKTEQQLVAQFDQLLDERLARVNQAAALRHLAELALGAGGKIHYRCSTDPSGLLIVAAAAGPPASETWRDLALTASALDSLPVHAWIYRWATCWTVETAYRWIAPDAVPLDGTASGAQAIGGRDGRGPNLKSLMNLVESLARRSR